MVESDAAAKPISAELEIKEAKINFHNINRKEGLCTINNNQKTVDGNKNLLPLILYDYDREKYGINYVPIRDDEEYGTRKCPN